MVRLIFGIAILIGLVYPLFLVFLDMLYYSIKGKFYSNLVSDLVFDRILFSVKVSLFIALFCIPIFIILSVIC